jgi:hypothetical protein
MSTFDANSSAYAIHAGIPVAVRFSNRPRVWSSGWKVAARALSGDSMQRLRECHDRIDPSGFQDFSAIGEIIKALIETRLPCADSQARLVVHEDVQRMLCDGTVPQICTNPTLVPLEIALSRAEELDYATTNALVKFRAMDKADENLFAAACQLSKQRASPNILHMTSRFVVPDPVEPSRTAHVFDQLWVCRDDFRPDCVRLFAIQLQRGIRQPIVERRLDHLFGAMGYQVIHASSAWSLVDAFAVMTDSLELANVSLRGQFTKNKPGTRIKDYQCAFCNGPMVRTPAGYGFVEHRERFVHEECFQLALNCGFYDWTDSPE